jgi:conjugal transfer pilus assembly protein TraI
MLHLLKKVMGKGETPLPHPPIETPPTVQSLPEDEIPRYPPFVKGLPASHPDRLIETQQELIGQIRESGLASKEVYEEFYLGPLRRFASYAHLLPASETHHHRGAGGLFRHAIEVALWSLQSGDRVLLPGDQTPRRRRELEPRWHSAVFLAALCHDLGKPITDLIVTNQDGAKVWDPFCEDLYTWAIGNQVDRYFLRWRKNRGTSHTSVSLLLVERIVGRSGLGWISQGDPNLVTWMMEAISGHPSQENMIHNLIVRSDQVSVTRDIEGMGATFAGYEIGIPVERILLDIMRRLVRDGVWVVNEPGSRLWHMDGHLYLIWPAGGEEIAAIVNQEKMPGLPRTPNSILDMLVERKLAEFKVGQPDGNRYWLIAPAILAEKIPDIQLKAIRLNNPGALLDSLPASVAGRLVGDDDPTTKSLNNTSVVAPTKPTEPTVEVIPATIVTSATPPADQPPDRLDGPVGEALKALVEDIERGRRDGSKLTHVDAAGILCLKWPDAFKGYGLENKTILDELGRRNWLVVDPMAPFRKVGELQVGIGAPWKILRLQPVVAAMMDINRAKSTSKKASKPAPKSESKPVAKVETTEKEATEKEATEPLQSVTPPVLPMVSSKEEGAVEKMVARQRALLEDVVGVLRQAVNDGTLVADQENGYLLINVRDAEAVLKAGIKASRSQIFGLKGIDPDRFTTEDRKPKVYFRIRA